MYIVLSIDKDKVMMETLRDEIKKRFPFIKFTLRDLDEKGFQLQLEGEADETKPSAYADGFMACWKVSHGSK